MAIINTEVSIGYIFSDGMVNEKQRMLPANLLQPEAIGAVMKFMLAISPRSAKVSHCSLMITVLLSITAYIQHFKRGQLYGAERRSNMQPGNKNRP